MKKIILADIRFFASLVVMHVVFFAIALHYHKIYNGDSAEYIYMATNIKNHGWFYAGNPVMPVQAEYLTLRPPLYSLFLAAVYCFTVNNWVVLVLQNLISIANICCLRDTIRKFGYSRKYDWILMAFVLLYPSQFVNANIIAPDILLQTFVLLYFRFFVLLMKSAHWKNGVWMSLSLIAAMMVKPVAYPLAFIHCLLMLGIWRYFRTQSLKPFFIALTPIVAVILYGSWNYERTGKLHFSSTQSFNAIFFYYTYLSGTEGREAAEPFLQKERAHLDSIKNFSERYSYANSRGAELVKSHFFPYIKYHLIHSASMLVTPGKGELDMFIGRLTLSKLYSIHQPESFITVIRSGNKEKLRKYLHDNPTLPLMMIVLFFNILKLVGFILFLLSKRKPMYLRLFIICIVGYFCLVAGPIANSRYFIPVSLIVAGTAAIAFQDLLLRQKVRGNATFA